MTIDLLQFNELEMDAIEQSKNQTARLGLADLIVYGEQLEQLNSTKEKMVLELEAVIKQIEHIETGVLPEGMKLLGIKDLTLLSGAKIALADVVSASITDDNREAAHDWLKANGHGDIIKNNVTLTFGKGENTVANELIRHLLQMRDAGKTSFGNLQQKEAVHPSTLKAFVKGQVENGCAFPGELFKLYTGQVVKMTK